MKTSVLKKSLLDYAIKGHLSAKWRRANLNPNAFDEIESHNAQILKDKKTKEQELKELESNLKTEKDKETKQALKQKIQNLKKDIAKLKMIVPLTCPLACHSEGDKPEESQRDISLAPQAQYDKDIFIPPFVIPKTWAWVRLGDICEMKKGPFGSAITKDMFIPKSEHLIKIYEQKNAIYKNIEFGEYYISPKHFEKFKQFEVFTDDIIVSCAGTIGEAYRIPNNSPKAIINQALMKMRLVKLEWIPYFLIVFDFLLKGQSQENSKGSAIKNIPPLEILKNFLIPLPPLSEQKQIVSILDSLIGLADSFDKTKEELKRIEKRIEKSLLQHAILGKISSKWRRDISASPQYDKIPNAFDEIEAYNAQILKDKKTKEQELKELESNLKIEKDKEAKQDLKQKIQNLKKDIAKLKTIVPLNKDISLVSQAQYDKDSFIPPFAIPKTWAWVRGIDILMPTENTEPKGKYFKYIDIDSIDNRNQVVREPKILKSEEASSRARRLLRTNDILFSIVRPYLKNIAFIDENLSDCIASTGFFVCRGISILYPKFLFYLMTSNFVVMGLNTFMRGDNSPSINKNDILNFYFPLPPLSEQQEIVRILDTLFALTKGLNVE